MKKKSVLVIDDEESIRISLKRMLEKEKFQVETAEDGSIALKKLRKHPYDLVLTDIMMGDISGIELLKNIRKKYSDVPVVLMTGYASIDSAVDALRLGASDYIIKPCSKKKILFSIGNAIKKNTPHKNKKTSQDVINSLKIVSGKKPLTKKELLVFKYLLLGLKSDEMATNLNVTLPTIKFHLKNIYSKLGITGRREIVKVMQSN
jgi:two-component system, NtrC family, nitrogen regulation response regulator NtrX